MNEKTFVDSNILIYAHDSQAGLKHTRAAAAIASLWDSRNGRLSVQVLQEFYVNVTQKIKPAMPLAAAREVVRTYSLWLESPATAVTIIRASEISQLAQLSFWDSLILASAEQDGAATLLTEDLSAGQTVVGIRVVNPLV
jgi:predicted nucleic acid-binding protein